MAGARIIMEELERRGRLASVSRLAANVERHFSDETPSAYATPIEYCLFARHRDTGQPVLAQLPHNWGGDVPVHLFYCHRIYKIFELFYAGDETEHVLFDVVADYAERFPGTVPPTALFYFVVRSCRDITTACQNVVPRLLRRCGPSLGAATDRNWLEETQLMEFVRFRPAWTTADVLAEFMRSVPRAADAVNVQHPVDGTTAAHICVRRSKFSSIKVLVDYGADIFNIKDRAGRTVLELARACGKLEDLVREIPAAAEIISGHLSAGGHSASSSMHFSGVRFDRFPKLYVPSAPNLTASGINEFMFEYVARELPELLQMEPALVIVPPVDGGGGGTEDVEGSSPHRRGTAGPQGWDSEMNLVRIVKTALEELRQKHPDLHIVCFHGLRYGFTQPEMGHCWEAKLDMVVTFRNAEGVMLTLILTEIKSITELQDLVKELEEDGTAKPQSTGAHGLDQLRHHIDALRTLVGADTAENVRPDWLVPILAVPVFPSRDAMNKYVDGSTPTREEEELETKWNTFLENSSISQDPQIKAYSEIQPQLMTRFVLEKPGALSAWLERRLDSISNKVLSTGDLEMEGRKQALASIVAWCVAHCMGIAVQRISDSIDQESEEITDNQLALLSVPQKMAYDASPSAPSDPLLLVGTAGTGKTLLALAKLIKCWRDGLITEDKRGLFLTHARNTSLIALVKKVLRKSRTEFIEVRALSPQDAANLKQELARAVSEKFSYVVIDQLEDLLYLTGQVEHEDCAEFVSSLKESGEMLEYLMQLTCFDLFWATVNPMDLPGARAHISFWAFCADYQRKLGRQFLSLNKRIRNTTSIGVFLGNPEAGEVYLPLHFGAEPMDIRTYSSSLGPRSSLFVQYFEGDHGEHATLAIVVARLALEGAVRDKHVAVIRVTDDDEDPAKNTEEAITWLKDADTALLRAGFCEPRAIPSMAPLLVQAAWAGDIKESLEEEELMAQVKESFAHATTTPLGHQMAHQDDTSLLGNLRRLLLDDNHRGDLVQWLGSVPEHIRRSVTFQATLSLVIRYISYTAGPSPDNKSRGDGFLSQLELALTSSDSGQGLRDLVARQTGFISVLNFVEVRGYEAEVVIVTDFSRVYQRNIKVKPAQLLSRAKVMAVLVCREHGRRSMESVFGPLPSLVDP